MASFEDYDEFGNYIGADLDSDDEDNIPGNQFQDEPVTRPLEGYEDVKMQEADDMALMEVDGMLRPFLQITQDIFQHRRKNLHIGLLSFMKINSTTLLQKMSMGLG